MDYARQQRDPTKHAIGIAFVVLMHLIVIYALLTGLGRTMIEVIKKPLTATIIEEIKAPPPPPPPPKKVITLKGVQMKSATKIDMPGDIEYTPGSAKLVMNDKSKKVLTQLATILKDNSEITKLRIEGNTDNSGEDKGFDNMKLSQERAQSIADYLTKNGVDAGRLVVVGYGSTHPLAPNDTKDHMALNRYTDFVVQEYNGQAVEDSGPPAGAVPATAAASASKDTAKAPKK
jgi:outer membrane protein OmpA-like peptidoglycan-associated protein